MNKSVFKSKTFYFGLLTALTPLFPALEPIIKDNLASFTMVWAGLTVALRFVTKDKVVLLD